MVEMRLAWNDAHQHDRNSRLHIRSRLKAAKEHNKHEVPFSATDDSAVTHCPGDLQGLMSQVRNPRA